jgi:CRISPR-associated protein Csm3
MSNIYNHLKALKEKIVIRGTLEPLTPLHIGWQRSFDPASSDAPVIKDPRGNPFIPGSSFKGIVRSFVEGFLDGAVDDSKKDLKPCFITDDNPCIKKKDLEQYDQFDDAKERKMAHILKQACPVCRIFGGAYMGSKLKIKDMRVKQEEWHEAFLRIRDGIVIDRESRTAKDKGKYDFETVSPDVTFDMEIIGDNLEEHEKGLLFIAFDLISQGYGSLGGNVSRGTGRIKIHVTEIEIFKPGDFFQNYLANNGKVEPVKKTGSQLDEYMKEAKQAFVKKFGNA